jgi:hypothetical protein
VSETKARRIAEARYALVLLIVAAVAGNAQQRPGDELPSDPQPPFVLDDAPRPPRLDDVPSARRLDTEPRRSRVGDDEPNAARLAPVPDARRDAVEEIVVIGENEWRLPDLGSGWRLEQEEQEEQSRISASFLPLYDPERETTLPSLMALDREARRVGYIELFRIRFGRRSRD